jgi:drug/metabolite transporter (DMT)-like permease
MWIPITLAAATFQILRTARQHELRSVLSTNAAGFVRYLYGAPFALLLSLIVFVVADRDFPTVPPRFWPIIIGAGVAQIIATVALLTSFKMRDFAVGTVYSKTEVLIVAGIGAVGIGTALEPLGWIGAVLVTIGVSWLASKGSLMSLLRRAGDPAALMGTVAGAGFAVAATGIGQASKSLSDAPSFDRALLTLTVMLVSQMLINAGWFAVTDRSEITRTLAAWRPATIVGLFSLLGSVGWAWAFTLESAAKVRILGQVEVIIAFVVAYVTLGDRHTKRDVIASGVVVAGVVVVTVFG